MSWDLFISHASEDKETVARPLSALLLRAGLRIWIDENELKLGDSLREKIDQGLASSRFGIVVLSPAFFAKLWPSNELNGLFSRESRTQRFILPVWHGIDKEGVTQYSPLLADRVAVSTKVGLPQVATEILAVVRSPASQEPPFRTDARPPVDNPAPSDPIPVSPDSKPGQSKSEPGASLNNPSEVRTPAAYTDFSEQPHTGPTVFNTLGISVIHTGAIRAIATSPDGKRAVSAGNDGRLLVWQIPGGECLASINTEPVLTLQWSHNGRFSLSGHKNRIRLWSPTTGRCLKSIDSGYCERLKIALSPDDRSIATASEASRVTILDLSSSKVVRQLEEHAIGLLRSVAWSPSGMRVLSGDNLSHVVVWKPDTGECLRVLDGHEWGVWSVAWSPDSRHAVSGDGRDNVRIWDIDTGRCVHTLKGHSYQVYNVAWNHGSRPVSADGAGLIRVWDWYTGRCVNKMKAKGLGVSALAWSSDDQHLVVGTNDNGVQLWDAVTGKLVKELAAGSLRWF